MTTFLIFFGAFYVVSLWALYRNNLALQISLEAIAIVSAEAKRRIARGEPWEQLYHRLDEKSYDAIMWDPRIWTARQAHPWLTELGA